MDWHSLSVNEAALRLKTDIKNGLSETEAEKRLRENGKNILSGKKKKSFLKKFISQFSDFMVLVLLLACAVSFLTSFLSGDKDYIDCIIILFIVILNAFIGTVQESRAEKALEALKKLSAPRAKVIRSGSFRDIEASALVKGDVISLSAGDSVPADCLIIESSSLKAEESSLTGESEPAEKKGGITLPVSTHQETEKTAFFPRPQ